MIIKEMGIYISLFLSLLLGVIDGHPSTTLAGIVITFLCSIHTSNLSKEAMNYSKRIIGIVVPCYLAVAFIFSLSFDEQNFFIVSDSMRYIQSYKHTLDTVDFDQIRRCYLEFADNNALYNNALVLVNRFANTSLGGSSVFFMTLFQTMFGALSVVIFYRILLLKFNVHTAYKYTLLYALCSHILFYSSVIIRDITIVYFYMLATWIIMSKFSMRNLAILICCIIIVWGIRLYSGLFLFAYLGYYLYVNVTTTRTRKLSLVFFIPMLLVFAGLALSTPIFEQTGAELNEYYELSNENSDNGMVSRLMGLPPGISQISLMFFAMIRPFPPFSVLSVADNLSNFVMASVFTLNGVFWFAVFYCIAYGFVCKGWWKKIGFEEKILILVVAVFLIANTAHADVRRMMPVFPILFIYFIKMNTDADRTWQKRCISVLLVGYFALGIII